MDEEKKLNHMEKTKDGKPIILLIDPKHRDRPAISLGIAYLAGSLRKSGYNVKVLDSNIEELDYKGVVNKIKDLKFDICGVAAFTPQIKEAWRILELLKKNRPEVITLLGGLHPTALPEESLKHPYVDFVLRGECDRTIVDFVKSIKNKDFSKVEGLSYKKKSKGKIIFVHNKKTKLIEDLDNLPFPARDLFKGFPEKYFSSVHKSEYKADILTSRGCPGTCNFCNKSIHGYKFRARSPENVIAEIEYLYDKFGIDYFFIVDDYFTADNDRVNKVCDLIIEKGLKIRWVCTSGIRVDNINLETLKKMKKAGCFRVSYGVESGSEEILRKIGKNIKLKQIRRAFDLAQEAGLITIAYFMIGNMWENEKTINQTIDFAKSLNTDYAQFVITKPFPGTILFKLIEKQTCGAKLLTKNWEKYDIFNSPIVFTTSELSKELLLRMYKKAHSSFYMRPKQIFFIVRKMIKTGNLDIAHLFGLGIVFLKQQFKK